jgi:mycoredoxin
VRKNIVMYTTPWCRDCRSAKAFLRERGVPFTEVDIEADGEAARLVMALNGGNRSVPTLDVEGTVVSGDRFDPERFEREMCSAGAL